MVDEIDGCLGIRGGSLSGVIDMILDLMDVCL